MRPITLFILMVFTLLLSACGQTGTLPSTPVTLPTSTSTPLPTSAPAECKVYPSFPTPDPTFESLIPPITEKDWSIGPENAKITILEYSDFQCPYCAELSPIVESLAKNNSSDVRLVFRHFPIPGHSLAMLASQAAEAAGMQGMFWEMEAVLMKDQGVWAGMDETGFKDWVVDQAKTLGMDAGQFATDLTGDLAQKRAKDALESAVAAGINQTPTLFINGVPISVNSQVVLQQIINLIRFEGKEFSECPPMTIDPSKKYSAVLSTEFGEITIELFADKAPWAVNSFVFLTREKWYDNTTFFSVQPGIAVIAGDPSGTGFGGPGYAYSSEITDLKFDKTGVVGVFSSAADLNGSRFFITLDELPQFDGVYTIFGQVTSGLDILEKFPSRDLSSPTGSMQEGEKILGVTITEN